MDYNGLKTIIDHTVVWSGKILPLGFSKNDVKEGMSNFEIESLFNKSDCEGGRIFYLKLLMCNEPNSNYYYKFFEELAVSDESSIIRYISYNYLKYKFGKKKTKSILECLLRNDIEFTVYEITRKVGRTEYFFPRDLIQLCFGHNFGDDPFECSHLFFSIEDRIGEQSKNPEMAEQIKKRLLNDFNTARDLIQQYKDYYFYDLFVKRLEEKRASFIKPLL